jgi:hypothetical protein
MKKQNIIILILLFVLIAGFAANNVTHLSRVLHLTGNVTYTADLKLVSSLNAYDNVYTTFVSEVTVAGDNRVWDENASAMGASTVTHVNAAVACTDYRATATGNRALNGWYTNVPSTIENGWYHVRYYNNATPATTDAVLLGRWCNINDGEIQSAMDL